MKLLFVQLPAQLPDWSSVPANVPLAAGYLASYAESKGLLSRREWTILEPPIANYGSDASIISSIVAREPDIIAFTLYSWNIKRSLFLAEKLSSQLPRARLIAGGPEVVKSMPITSKSPFNSLIYGEGEEAFTDILQDIQEHRPISSFYSSDNLVDLNKLPNPYLSGALYFDPNFQVHIETMRGCNSRCSYCYYGKNYKTVRHFPHEQILEVIRLASEAGVPEIYIMDPNFQTGSDFAGKLRDIAFVNHAHTSIHTELRLEGLDEEIAGLLKEAGIISVEAGLQSTNSKALEAVHRSFDRKAFERGAELLQRQKIIIKTGLILGLPYDGYEQIIETFDFLGMQGLGQEAELYPLSLLPGTEIRERADEYGMSAMDAPPYLVTSTHWISYDDMVDAISAFEESFDVEWAMPPAPHFQLFKEGFVSFIDFRKPENIDWMRLNPEKLSNSITLLIDADDPETLSRVVRAARDLRKDNPYTLYQIVLTSETRIPSEKLVERIRDAFLNSDHYYELLNSFSPDPQTSYQTRIFFATKNFALAYRALEEAQDMETMVILSGKGGYNSDRLSELLPYVIFDKLSLPFDRLYELISIYADFPHMLIEAPEGLF
ncbi:MAG TPA: radical SAM protein [Rectinema sp.]|nr:radical SAM protein [Rectinema sp.]